MSRVIVKRKAADDPDDPDGADDGDEDEDGDEVEDENDDDEGEACVGELVRFSLVQQQDSAAKSLLVILECLPVEIIKLVCEYLDEDDDFNPDARGPFVVVQVYYKHGDVSIDHYQNVSSLLGAMLEHEQELKTYKRRGLIENVVAESGPFYVADGRIGYRGAGEKLLSLYARALRGVSVEMTYNQLGCRWESIIAGTSL